MKETGYFGLSEKELYAALVWGLVAGSSVPRIRAKWWRVALSGVLAGGLAAGAARVFRSGKGTGTAAPKTSPETLDPAAGRA